MNWNTLRRLAAVAVMTLFVADVPPGPHGGCRKVQASPAAVPGDGIQG